MRVNGLYGHIRLNHLRSLAMFAGFALAVEIIAAAVLMLPLFFLDFFHCPFLFPLAYLGKYGLPILVGALVIFAGNCLSHVNDVRAAVGHREVSAAEEPRLARLVEVQAIQAGIRMPKLGVIERQVLNAFAVGFTSGSATVVVSRGLLTELDDEELEAVVAHEIAHIANGDIGVMAIANAMAASVGMLARWNFFKVDRWWKLLPMVLMPPLFIVLLIGGFLSKAAETLAALSRYLVSSSREFIADAQAVEMTKNPAALVSALGKIEGRSDLGGLEPSLASMMIDGADIGALATHPPIGERISMLRRLTGGMAIVPEVRKDTRPMEVRSRGIAAGRRDRGLDLDAFRARMVVTAAPVGTSPAAAVIPKPGLAGLVQRVDAGTGTNWLGMTPRLARAMVVVHVVVAGLFAGAMVLMVSTANRQFKADEDSHVRATVRGFTSGYDDPNQDPVVQRMVRVGIVSSIFDPGDWRYNPPKLHEMDPLEARCFSGQHYIVGDAGFRKLRSSDAHAPTSGGRGRDAAGLPIELEWHDQTLGLVQAAQTDAELDAALARYIGTRRALIEVIHRFYAEEGLDHVARLYSSPADAGAVEKLRRRVAAGATFWKTEREGKEIRLLVEAPDDFVTCEARAERNAAAGFRAPDTIGLRPGV